MNLPPTLMHVKVKSEGANFGLWLPLFLLLPLALVVLIILSPLILIAILVLWPSGKGPWALFALRAAFTAFWSLRGLKVDVEYPKSCVYIYVI